MNKKKEIELNEVFEAGKRAVLKNLGFLYFSEKRPSVNDKCLVLLRETDKGILPAIRTYDGWDVPRVGYIEDAENRVIAWSLLSNDIISYRPSPAYSHCNAQSFIRTDSYSHYGSAIAPHGNDVPCYSRPTIQGEGFCHHI